MEVIFNHETNTASVVAILINPRLGYIVRQIKHDNEGRILNILLQLDDHTFNIVNINFTHCKQTMINGLLTSTH